MRRLYTVLLAATAFAAFGIAAAQMVPGGEPPPETPSPVPEVAPPLPPPPPPTTASSSAGIVTSISFDDLKALFDAAGVAYEIKTFDGGWPYLSASPEGFQLFASVTDCPDATTLVGCTAVALESGRWTRKTTLEELNAFNGNYVSAKAFLGQDGQPGIIYTFRIGEGVSPTFVRSELKTFVGVMKYFGGWEWLPKTAAAAPAAGGSFSTGAEFGAKVLTGSVQAKGDLPQRGGKPTQH